MPPQTRYARSGGVNLAYQVLGDGPVDLVYVPGWVSHVELGWEDADLAHGLGRLASFARLILFDKRGTGMSDRVPVDELPTLEQRMDDVRAVMDEVGSERAALFGTSEGGGMSALFAATYPERTVALCTFGIFARRIWDRDYPWAPTPAEREHTYEIVERDWATGLDASDLAPSLDPARLEALGTYVRRSASPGAGLALLKMNTQIDIRDILPVIQVPTLVMHRSGDLDAKVEEGRWIAEQIAGARYVEMPGTDHLWWTQDCDNVVDEIQGFLTGVRPVPEPDRVLTTVLFTDIVGSTEQAAELGDRRWTDLLEQHHTAVRNELARFRGREIDTAGDGFLATFDGPARAIRCATAVRDRVRDLGLELRAGVHTGECELHGDSVSGIAVHIGARIASEAGPGDVFVSATVHDLVAGSGIRFEDRGEHELKGLAPRRIYAVIDQ